MKVKEVPFSWIPRSGYRLDVEPFVGGAVETRVFLERAAYPKQPLRELTTGHNGGIYNGPMFRRNYVESREHGVPFLTSGSMLRADVADVGLLRRKDAESPRLSYLRLTKGTTLISCSGSIGRSVYTRPDMEGMWASQDIMKVVPDPEAIPPGYLYTFLSSKFGVPMITSGTYGAIIQHIEPEHIAELLVPRLGEAIEAKAHALAEEAASNRTKAIRLRSQALDELCSSLDLPDFTAEGTPLTFAAFEITARSLGRLDAAHHSPSGAIAVAALEKYERTLCLGDVAKVFQTNIFKRPYVDDPQYGYPYFSGAELFTYDPLPRGYLRKKAPGMDQYVVERDWLLMQDAGQLGGLIGRLIRVTADQDGSVVSNHLIRIAAETRVDAGYLFALLSSPIGYRAVLRNAFGSSIPQLESAHLRGIKIPWPEDNLRERIADPILASWDLEDNASELDRQAVALVERAIEEAA